MIVFAATPIPNPEFLNRKYVKYTVPAPAPIKRVPKTTLPAAINRLCEEEEDALGPASVVRFLRNEELMFSTTFGRDIWLLSGLPSRQPAIDTLMGSGMDGSPQLGVPVEVDSPSKMSEEMMAQKSFREMFGLLLM